MLRGGIQGFPSGPCTLQAPGDVLGSLFVHPARWKLHKAPSGRPAQKVDWPSRGGSSLAPKAEGQNCPLGQKSRPATVPAEAVGL